MKKIILASVVLLFTMSSCCDNKTKCSTVCDCSTDVCTDPDSLRMVVRVPAKVKPEFVAAFKQATEIVSAASLAEEGCMEYKLYQSPNDSTLFFLDEMWVNKHAHRNHMTLDHFKVYINTIREMKDSDQPRAAEEIKICPVANAKTR